MGVIVMKWVASATVLIGLGLFGLSVRLFLETRIQPADFARVIAEQADLTPEDRQRLERALGLDRSIAGQYWRWLGIVFAPPGYTYVFTQSVRRKE